MYMYVINQTKLPFSASIGDRLVPEIMIRSHLILILNNNVILHARPSLHRRGWHARLMPVRVRQICLVRDAGCGLRNRTKLPFSASIGDRLVPEIMIRSHLILILNNNVILHARPSLHRRGWHARLMPVRVRQICLSFLPPPPPPPARSQLSCWSNGNSVSLAAGNKTHKYIINHIIEFTKIYRVPGNNSAGW